MEQSFPCVVYPKYSPPNHRIQSSGWHLANLWHQQRELNLASQHFHGFHGTLKRISIWRNRTVDDMTVCLPQCLQTGQTAIETEISLFTLFYGRRHIISVFHFIRIVQLQKVDFQCKLTEFVAKICRFGLESSINFWTIRKNDSTNKFNVCAWQAIKSKSIASIAISTSLTQNKKML